MKDILLTSGGDLSISEDGDIRLAHSVRQEVKIILQWFFAEWRFGPDLGLPYFEEVFVKNPNTDMIAQIVRTEAAKADGAKEIQDVSVVINTKTRDATIQFTIITDYGTFREEVEINV